MTVVMTVLEMIGRLRWKNRRRGCGVGPVNDLWMLGNSKAKNVSLDNVLTVDLVSFPFLFFLFFFPSFLTAT